MCWYNITLFILYGILGILLLSVLLTIICTLITARWWYSLHEATATIVSKGIDAKNNMVGVVAVPVRSIEHKIGIMFTTENGTVVKDVIEIPEKLFYFINVNETIKVIYWKDCLDQINVDVKE